MVPSLSGGTRDSRGPSRSIREIGCIPPAARRPATALVLVLVIITLIYTLFAPTIPLSLPLLPTSDNSIAYSEPQAHPQSPDPKTDLTISPEYNHYFPSGQLPSAFNDPIYSTLGERLVNFLNRPIYDHAESRGLMEEHCPLELADNLVNPDQYKGSIDFWRDQVGKEVIMEKRASLVNWLAGRIESGEKVVWDGNSEGKGRGIVMTGGNKDTAARLVFLLRHLQSLGSTLPIEVFHYPDELTDTSQRNLITSLGATIHQIRGVTQSPGAWKNWQIKGLALVQSSFQEIISLDSDNTPLRDISHLFDSTIYTLHGRAAFWPDLNKDHPANAIWRLVGQPCTLDDWTLESGQMVIDKGGNGGLNLAALYLASGMMDDKDFWFRMCGGDKDTFRWAWRILDLDFGRSPRWMSSVGIMTRGRYCGHTVLQYDLTTLPGQDRPRPLFAHSNLLKHLRGYGLSRGKLFTHIKRFSLDTYSHNTLNYARQWVYTGNRGMCLDTEWFPLAEERLSEAEKKEFEIEVVPVQDVEGGAFDGFEDAFFDKGGVVGGW